MKKKVFAYLHTHWDLEWYRNEQDFNMRFLEVFDVVLDELKNNRAPFFYLDGQVVALLNYLKYRKNKKDEIIKLIQEKKLAIGPFFVSADSFLINYRSMLKNLELGLKISKDFSQKEFIGYLSDIFGISKSIFCALNEKNIDKAIIWRGVNPKKINNNCNFLYDKIKTTWLIQGYFNDFFHSENIEGIKKTLDKINNYSPVNLLLPIGADHLGILKNANEKIKKINKNLNNYEIILTSPFEYFKNNDFKNKTKEIEFLDNSDTYILPGVYSARIYQKIENNILQNKISRIVEPLNYYLKQNFDDIIEDCYKQLIKNHAHDGIYGCSIDDVHKTISARNLVCNNQLDSILNTIIKNFKEKYNLQKSPKNKIGLFNLSINDNIKTIKLKSEHILKNSQILSWEECFTNKHLYDIYKIPVTEEITKIYTQLVEISSNKSLCFNTVKIQNPIKKTKTTLDSIENEKIKLKIDNNKIFIQDKKTNNSFEIKLTDIKDDGDSYNCAPVGKFKTLDILKTKIIYDDRIESCLEIIFKDIKLRAKLSNHSNFINFEAKINNKKKNHKLQLNLILKENIAKTIAQDAFGTIERNHDFNYNIQNFMPAKRPFELKTNFYPMQNFVCTQGIGILTKGLHEYEIYQNTLKVCLLRAFNTISNPKNKTRAIPAGPNLKTPDGQCLGDNTANFAIFFGNDKKAFCELDNFFENYVAIDNEIEKDFAISLNDKKDYLYFYGIDENKKLIGYKK